MGLPTFIGIGPVADKVDEAAFFLEELCRSGGDLRRARHLFSAFCTASRSITFTLQSAMSGCQGFLEWYESWQARLKADPEARFFVEVRNSVEKRGQNPLGIAVGSGYGPVIPAATTLYFVPIADGREALTSPPREAVPDVCRRHMSRLASLLQEVLDQFGGQVDIDVRLTHDFYARHGLTIEDAEREVYGPSPPFSRHHLNDDARWKLIREDLGVYAIEDLKAAIHRFSSPNRGRPPQQ